MTVNLSALAGAGQQFFNNSGVILTGGKLYSYAAGTTTPQTCYTTAAGNVAHTNPIILDSSGRVATGEIWLTAGSNYKFVLTDSNNVLIATWDNITGINGTGIASNASNVQYDPAGAGAVSTTVQAKLRQTASFKDFGAVGDGVTDDRAAIQAAIDAVGGAGGGVIDGSGLTYCVDSANGCAVNYDNVLLQNFTFKRTNAANTGYTLRFATTTNTNGGGVINARFIGIPTVAAMAGLSMGTATYKANNYVLNNIESSLHGQYGIGIEAGDNWKISNIRIIDHGLTTGSITSCMGFYIYPKIASSGGQLNNVSSQISAACVANTLANTAAIKLETHQNLTATNIRVTNGREEAISIYCVDGTISNLFVTPQAGRPGIVVGNYNPGDFSDGQKFTLDGFVVQGDGSAPNNDFIVAGGTNGQYSIIGCVIRNGKSTGAGYLNYSAAKDCVFENLSFGSCQLSAAILGYSVNSVPSTNNTYRNVSVDGTTGIGTFAIETSDSLLQNCAAIAATGKTVNSIFIYGDNNLITSPASENCSTNAFTIRGDSNTIYNPQVKATANRTIFFGAGYDNNIVYGNNSLVTVANGISDVGSGNLFYNLGPLVLADALDTNRTPVWTDGIRTYIWASPISADRTVTLATTSIPTGAKYRIVRKTTATGAFNLNVGTGPLKALTAGQWCDVEYDGSAWVLTAFGSL